MSVVITVGLSGHSEPPTPHDNTWSVFMVSNQHTYGIDLSRDKDRTVAISEARLVLTQALGFLEETKHTIAQELTRTIAFDDEDL